MIISDDRCYR